MGTPKRRGLLSPQLSDYRETSKLEFGRVVGRLFVLRRFQSLVGYDALHRWRTSEFPRPPADFVCGTEFLFSMLSRHG
jgi:hypothetical protein